MRCKSKINLFVSFFCVLLQNNYEKMGKQTRYGLDAKKVKHTVLIDTEDFNKLIDIERKGFIKLPLLIQIAIKEFLAKQNS